MKHPFEDEIYQIIDEWDERWEDAAKHRRWWLESLPEDLARMVKMSVAAYSMMRAAAWHERNGGLPEGSPSYSSARKVFDESSLYATAEMNTSDLAMFEECIDMVDQIGHGPECVVCIGMDTENAYRSNTVWELLTL